MKYIKRVWHFTLMSVALVPFLFKDIIIDGTWDKMPWAAWNGDPDLIDRDYV